MRILVTVLAEMRANTSLMSSFDEMLFLWIVKKGYELPEFDEMVG